MGMNLDRRKSAQVTTLKVVDPIDPDEDTGVEITGHVPRSKAWDKAHAKIYGAPKKQTLFFDKKRQYTEIEPGSPRQRIAMLAAVVTDITGIDRYDGKKWTYSQEAVQELFSDPAMVWLVDQWEEHLGEAKGFMPTPETNASSGPNVTAG